MPEGKAVRARVEGRVQKVAFRKWAQIEAQVRGLAGWIRNEPDGAVTVLLAGPSNGVDEMLHVLERGPPAAVVHSVEVRMADWPEGERFEILRS